MKNYNVTLSPRFTAVLYVEWCKKEGLKPSYASSLDKYKEYLENEYKGRN